VPIAIDHFPEKHTLSILLLKISEQSSTPDLLRTFTTYLTPRLYDTVAA